jgi:hypothetical protein
MSWWTWPGLRGAVLEQIPGRLVDIGAGGCSVETTARVGAGTFGFVEIDGPDASLAEVARVCDVTERQDAAAPFLVRLEFLPVALPSHLMPSDGARRSSLATAREKAGPSLTLVSRDGQRVDAAGENAARNGPPEADASEPPPVEPLADGLKKS